MFSDKEKAERIQEMLMGVLRAITKWAQMEEWYYRNGLEAAEIETDYTLFPHELHHGNFERIGDAFSAG